MGHRYVKFAWKQIKGLGKRLEAEQKDLEPHSILGSSKDKSRRQIIKRKGWARDCALPLPIWDSLGIHLPGYQMLYL